MIFHTVIVKTSPGGELVDVLGCCPYVPQIPGYLVVDHGGGNSIRFSDNICRRK